MITLNLERELSMIAKECEHRDQIDSKVDKEPCNAHLDVYYVCMVESEDIRCQAHIIMWVTLVITS